MSLRYKAKRRQRYYRGRWEIEASDETLEIRCWCGACGTYDQLFDDSGLDDTCGGSGVLSCRCGGDLCVCHHHGETECIGCEDCEEADDLEEVYDEIL